MKPIIELQNVSKKFATGREGRTTQEYFLSGIRKIAGLANAKTPSRSDLVWALENVSFSVLPGETVGLIGRNGAGKSSLLKLMTGVLRPTHGKIIVDGSIAALLELGAGFHPDLTGLENIFLNGSILGYSRSFLKERVGEIIDFAELGEFIDMPVKHYSSGMLVRLGFAIATATEPQILLVDEVLAVGDLAFQAKCITRINKMKLAGTTIVFVSHDPKIVRKLCDRCIWLEYSRIQMMGPSDVVIDRYEEAMTSEEIRPPLQTKSSRTGERWGSRVVEIADVRFLDGTGAPQQEFTSGKPFTVEICYRAHQPIEMPAFGMAIYRADGIHVSGTNTTIDGFSIEVVEGEGRIIYHLEQLPLLTGDYEFSAVIYDYESIYPYDHHHRMYTFSVRQEPEARRLEGIVRLPANWQHEADTVHSETVRINPY